jgi:chemotaxis family two-component system sensor kinase Cph1
MSLSSQSSAAQTHTIDRNNWEEENIHLCNYIQPQGVLMALEYPSIKILQVSNNTQDILGVPPEELLGKPLNYLFADSQIAKIKKLIENHLFDAINIVKLSFIKNGKYLGFNSIVHQNDEGMLILELEKASYENNINFLEFYALVKSAANQLQNTANIQQMCDLMAKEVRKITGFDRVMVYKFHPDGHGSVIAEDKANHLEPLYGLHYPDADTKPTRQLFSMNWVRLIPDCDAEPVGIIPDRNPINNRPLDLSLSVFRGVSTCHIEYLKNMGVQASLSMSLRKNNQLWGLIACHHYASPKYLAYELRQACEFLGQVMSLELLAKEDNQDHEYELELKSIQAKLIEYLSIEAHLADALVNHQPNLLDLVTAPGAAICLDGLDGNLVRVGVTPDESDLKSLIQWLDRTVEEDVFYTDSLAQLYPEAEKFKDIASGLLAISISKHLHKYIVWFRPEYTQTVNWAGNPHQAVVKNVDSEGNVRLSPRGSFAEWQETVRLKSLPWKPCEIEAAAELRNATINIVLRQVNELEKLTKELERGHAELEKFAETASHDLQEPLDLVANSVQLLKMRYENQLDQDAKDLIGSVEQGVKQIQTLMNDWLADSQVD